MKSIWKEKSPPEIPSLQGDCKTDVLIIGGGIAGILTAYFLDRKNIDYILLEKNKILNSTTSNTTAKITYQHGLIYDKILRSYGLEKAQMYLKANQTAFAEYEKLCDAIDCNFEYKDNYVYSIENHKKLIKEIKALEKIGYNAEFCDILNLPISTVGGVKFKNQAQFHPLKFLKSISKNLNIRENTFVKEISNTTAITDKGKIKAKKIIVTTHFPFINKHGNYFLKLYQHRSYVIALENAKNVNGMYVDENKDGLSFRNYGNLLLLGGGGHRTGYQGGNWQELHNFSSKKYPHSKELYHWAAQDCMSLDNIPYIGKYSANTPNLYVASGFNKWGITSSMTAAMILSDMVTDIKNEYSDVFHSSRSILKFQLLINGLETTKNLLTFTKPRCPHLGCALKWNKAEHSWDCSCHGSRFSKDGIVLDNPANGNIDL